MKHIISKQRFNIYASPNKYNINSKKKFSSKNFNFEYKNTDEQPATQNKALTRPENGKFLNFNHLEFWVGNAKQAASYYTSKFGFDYFQYSGLETGNRKMATHVVKNGAAIFAFKSPLQTGYNPVFENFLKNRGDAIRDISIEVDDIELIAENAKQRGAIFIEPIREISDNFGSVKTMTVQTFGDVVHTFIEKKKL